MEAGINCGIQTWCMLPNGSAFGSSFCNHHGKTVIGGPAMKGAHICWNGDVNPKLSHGMVMVSDSGMNIIIHLTDKVPSL